MSASEPRPVILSLCDRSGVMVAPWAEAGFSSIIVDLRHPPGWTSAGLLTRVGADVRCWTPPLYDYGMVFAFPPCTDLANSGARWFRGKGLRSLAGAIELVAACAEIAEATDAPYMIENPVGQLSTYWRKPDHTFDPYEYGAYLELGGDAYTKRTCLWTGGGFVMPAKRPVPPVLGSKMHVLPPSDDRADLRSITPAGFARAVFEANIDHVLRRAA